MRTCCAEIPAEGMRLAYRCTEIPRTTWTMRTCHAEIRHAGALLANKRAESATTVPDTPACHAEIRRDAPETLACSAEICRKEHRPVGFRSLPSHWPIYRSNKFAKRHFVFRAFV
jgi:hypothetical protein